MLLLKVSPEKKVRFISVLGLAMLVSMGWYSYNSISELFEPFGWITHTQEILEQIGALTNEVTDIQSSARGYVLSGDKKYLRPYHVALWSIPNTLWELNEETRDNPQQQNHLNVLKPEIKSFIAIYTRVIRLRRKVGEEKINVYVEKDAGFNAMNNVMQTIHDMSREERKLLVLRDADELSIARRIRWTIIIIVFVAALILLSAGVNINRHILVVKTINEKLREKEAIIFQFLSGLSIGVFVAKADGKTYFANHAALRLLGRDIQPEEDFYEFPNSNTGDLVETEKTTSVEKSPLALALQGIASTQTNMIIHRPGGETVPVEVSGIPILGSGGQLTYALTTFTDISERIKHQTELKNLAIRDELTGLFNRRGFMTLAEQQLKVADRAHTALLLLFIDLDGFKQVNDQGGHAAGDALLIEFTHILQSQFRRVDIVGRLGGDEFGILTEDRLTDDSMVIYRLKETIEARNQANPQGYRLDFSVGAALYHPERPCGLEQLIAQADERMYIEKQKKKDKLSP